MSVKLTLSLLIAAVAVAHCANILDFLNLEDAKKLIEPAAELRNDPSCKWKCKGPACACCIEQNITSYEPEGAKCVHLRYLSKEEGLFVQISHGKKIDYAKVQASNPEPLCLVMGVLFQMCASFSHMAPTNDGVRGCVNLEPGTIFLSQRKVPLGCFRAREEGMEMMEPPKDAVPEEEEDNTEENTEETDVDFDPNKFFAGVYQTAQQSLALLTSLLETPNKNSTKPATPTEASTSSPQENPQTSQRRVPKNLKHPNQL